MPLESSQANFVSFTPMIMQEIAAHLKYLMNDILMNLTQSVVL